MSSPLYQQINLYQPIFRRQRQVFSALMMLQVTGVVAAALLAIYFYGAWQVVGLEAEAVQLEGREKAYSAQLGRLDPASSTQRRRDVEQEIQQINTRLIDQQQLIEILQAQPFGGTEGFSAQLAALARRHTNGLWLTELRIHGADRSLELVGKTVEPDLVPQYLRGLGQEDALAGQRFERMQIERTEDGREISFRVTGRASVAADWQTKLVSR